MNTPAQGTTVNILLSEAMAEAYGPRMRSLAEPLGIRLYFHPPTEETRDVQETLDIAFFSRDVFGHPDPDEADRTLRRFFSIVEHAQRLAWLHICSSGSDRNIYRRLQQRGVCVTTSAGTNKESVGTMALAAMLFWNKDIPRHLRNQADRRWEPIADEQCPRRLSGQTAIIIGTGHIGSEIARYLKALRLTTVGINRRGVPTAGFDEVHSPEHLHTQSARADWLFVCCPLTEQTKGLVSEKIIARLPGTAGVINVARGGVVDEAALSKALAERRIAFAYLDVFASEPLPAGSSLWRMDNVLATPHIAARMTGINEQVGEGFLDNFARWIQGKQLANIAQSASPA